MTPAPGELRGDAPLVAAWAPLRHATYRRLWTAWVAACLCMWMNEVAAAWLMTTLTASPVMVALVQTASTLPIFVVGLPAGAVADIADRRRLLMLTQAWAIVVALLLFVSVLGGALTPAVLLMLVFANGVVLALRWPAFSAVVPELVPAHELAAASALSGVANNGSRIGGPLIAGAVIAAAGTAYVFALNAVLSLLALALLARWTYAARSEALPSERFVGAMRVGLQHVRQSARMRPVLVHAAVFFANMIALTALLPLVARRFSGSDPKAFALLLASMGAGAIVGALLLPHVNRRFAPERRLASGAVAFAAATAGVAASPWLLVSIPAMLAAGVAFMVVANTLMVVGTLALPGWVRARGLAIYQMAMMGASAAGAALWGSIATLTSVQTALLVAAASTVAGVVATRRIPLPVASPDEVAPAGGWSVPEVSVPLAPDVGPVLVTIEYRIDPARIDEFLAVMRESRREWLGHGLLAWSLFSDVGDPGRHIEHMVDESWVAYVRRNERVSASYLRLRDRKHAMHLGPGTPAVTRYIGRSVDR